MHPILEKTKAQLLAQPANCSSADTDALLKMLYIQYTALHPIDSAAIRSSFDAVNQVIGRLSVREDDLMTDLVCRLCGEYERAAFLEGLRVGARLFTELDI